MNTHEEEIVIPLAELETVDVSDKHLEKMARGFIMGSQAIGRRREIRQVLEEKVTKRIGTKGKYLTDKLFELIEGVYVMEKRKDGKKGEIRYYQVPPNLQAIIYALDRVLGKPKQVSEHSEEKKGIILVEHVIKNMANNPYKNVKRRNEGQLGTTPGGTVTGGGNGSAGTTPGEGSDDGARGSVNAGVGAQSL